MSRREYRREYNSGDIEIQGYTIVNALVGNGVNAAVRIPNVSTSSSEIISFAAMPTSQGIGYYYCSGKGTLRLMLLDVGTTNNRYDYSYGTGYQSLYVDVNHHARDVIHTFVHQMGKLTIDGVEYTTQQGSNITANPPVLCLFAADFDNNSILSSFFAGKIYYFRRELNGNIIMDLIPVMRNSDAVVGMYDLITNTFYEAIGDMQYE